MKIVLLGMVLLMIVSMMGCFGASESEPTPMPTPTPTPALTPTPILEPKIGLSVGDIAPDFQLEDLNGNQVSLWDLRGKVVLLNFWASWCVYCKKEMPSMETIYQDYKEKGFEILAVNIKGDREDIKIFIEQKRFSFPVLLDSDDAVAVTYQIKAVPTTYIIDSRGIIRRVIVGSVDWIDPAFRQIIESLL